MALAVGVCSCDHPLVSRPNVVLVSVDTTRADRLGCYGYPAARTPEIDRLARRGVLFRDAVSAVPLTLPSHASIMTGLLPCSHGVRHNVDFALSADSKTLAEIAKERGYNTAAFVGSVVLDSQFGLNQGFEVYDDQMDSPTETCTVDMCR